MTKKQQGGRRAGAGRKPSPNAKIPYGMRLDPQIVEFLREQDNGNAVVEKTIKTGKPFRDWLRNRQAQK